MSTSKSFCDYYTVLGIAPTATVHDIKKAFRKLAILHHPDKKDPKDISDASDFCILRKAYEILNEPALRREYDRQYNLHN
ncbi:heat shock protein DnaJ, partial [Massarina eburnea CBS 473.64]